MVKSEIKNGWESVTGYSGMLVKKASPRRSVTLIQNPQTAHDEKVNSILSKYQEKLTFIKSNKRGI